MSQFTNQRRKARELVLQALFQMEFQKQEPTDSLEVLLKQFSVDEETKSYATQICLGLTKNWDEVDRILSSLSQNWKPDRMAIVDRNLLRIALYEMKFESDTPPKVAINEAIELGKKYGNTESSQFLNGLLDQALKEIQ